MRRSGRLTGAAYLLCCAFSGCGARTNEGPKAQTPSTLPAAREGAHAPATRSTDAPASKPSGALASDAQYGDLVRAAGELEGVARSPSGCLLAATRDGFSLRAELSAAVRPLPLPPAELDEVLKQAAQVEILSAWGRYGDGSAPLSLAVFTDTAPTRLASALVLTDRGVRVRPASGGPGASFDARDLAGALVQLTDNAERTWFVTAEAGVPVARVAEALARLGERAFKVALAVALSRDTQLPRPPPAKVALCDDGLPATELPEGSLPRAAIDDGIAPLRTLASDCLGRGDARGAAGGRIELAIRVGPSGRVQDACATRDALGDPAVLACVLDLARRLSFASPAPSGVIDLGLPVVLLPGSRPTQRPLCPEP